MLYNFFLQNRALYEKYVKMYGEALLASNDNMLHARSMLESRC